MPSQVAAPAVTVYERGPNLFIRFLWWLFIGWWASGFVVVIAWVALVTIIGIPLGIWIINRIPTILTLRPRTRPWSLGQDEYGTTVMQRGGPAAGGHGRSAGSGSCSSAGGRPRSGWAPLG